MALADHARLIHVRYVCSSGGEWDWRCLRAVLLMPFWSHFTGFTPISRASFITAVYTGLRTAPSSLDFPPKIC